MGNCLPMARLAFDTLLDLCGPAATVLGRDSENFNELFKLGRELGKGSYGRTYLCEQRSSGLEFACKVIEKRKVSSSKRVRKVCQEVEIMHHVAGNPHIVNFHDAYEDTVRVYLVMELCSGGELFARIGQRKHYSEREAARFMQAIVKVVQTCHSLNVMHRDLKPDNFLFLNEEEEAPLKAIDFGLSLFFEPGAFLYTPHTHTHGVDLFKDRAGTPFYMAPELLQKRYGPKADVWSAGVLLYLLLSGKTPFLSETGKGIFDQVCNGELDFTTDPWPQISDCAKDLIRNILNQDQTRRFTAHDILCHPWICQDGVAPDRPLDPAVLTRMKQYMAMNKMKKIALSHITKRLKEEEIKGLKRTFKMMDSGAKGALTLEDLKVGLQWLGASLEDDEVGAIFKGVDLSQSGSIDIDEFVAATLHPYKWRKEENLGAAFSLFDKNGSGFITKNELQKTCLDLGMNDTEVQDIVREIDQNNDSWLETAELVSFTFRTGYWLVELVTVQVQVCLWFRISRSGSLVSFRTGLISLYLLIQDWLVSGSESADLVHWFVSGSDSGLVSLWFRISRFGSLVSLGTGLISLCLLILDWLVSGLVHWLVSGQDWLVDDEPSHVAALAFFTIASTRLLATLCCGMETVKVEGLNEDRGLEVGDGDKDTGDGNKVCVELSGDETFSLRRSILLIVVLTHVIMSSHQ
ncbi:hypothetical protein L7F22_033137 [Adiantum nelumboides]|nr:hypothetical protein [Adiantum nelumboides]